MRRTIGFFITLALAIFMAPRAAEAPPPGRVPCTGTLQPGASATNAHFLEAFRQGLRLGPVMPRAGWTGLLIWRPSSCGSA